MENRSDAVAHRLLADTIARTTASAGANFRKPVPFRTVRVSGVRNVLGSFLIGLLIGSGAVSMALFDSARALAQVKAQQSSPALVDHDQAQH